MKNPWGAALLNLIPGLGYLYVGTRKVFASLMLVGIAAAFASAFDPILASYDPAPTTPWDIITMLAFMAAFMADAFLEAKRVSSEVNKKSKKA